MELTQLAWLNAKLHDDIVAGIEQLPPAADRARQRESEPRNRFPPPTSRRW